MPPSPSVKTTPTGDPVPGAEHHASNLAIGKCLSLQFLGSLLILTMQYELPQGCVGGDAHGCWFCCIHRRYLFGLFSGEIESEVRRP